MFCGRGPFDVTAPAWSVPFPERGRPVADVSSAIGRIGIPQEFMELVPDSTARRWVVGSFEQKQPGCWGANYAATAV